MTLLQIVQTLCKELSIGAPDTVIGNTDKNVIQMLAFVERAGRQARSDFKWPELNREYTWDIVSGQANYAFPDDYHYQLFATHWDRTSQWELIGPLTPQEWQYLKSGIGSSASARRRFRIKGVADKQIFIDPTPAASGDTLVLEYQSLNWIRPKTWAQSTVFAAGAYCFYNGNYYYTSAGGVSGSTAPTHTSGASSDGGISWTYSDDAYETFTADTDVPLLCENCLILDAKWRFRHEKGLEWQSFKLESDKEWKKVAMDKKGSSILSMNSTRGSFLLSSRNLPETGLGS